MSRIASRLLAAALALPVAAAPSTSCTGAAAASAAAPGRALVFQRRARACRSSRGGPADHAGLVGVEVTVSRRSGDERACLRAPFVGPGRRLGEAVAGLGDGAVVERDAGKQACLDEPVQVIRVRAEARPVLFLRADHSPERGDGGGLVARASGFEKARDCRRQEQGNDGDHDHNLDQGECAGTVVRSSCVHE